MTDEQITEIDKSDVLTDYLLQLEEKAGTIAALGKEKQTNAQTVVYVAKDGNDISITAATAMYYILK